MNPLNHHGNRRAIMRAMNLTVAPLSLAAYLAGELGTLYHRGEPDLSLLDDLSVAVEAAPELDRDELCYFRNRLASSRRLVARGEFGAAEYEMHEMRLKLVARIA